MRQSKILIPTLKEDPSDAEVVSHKLMMRAGLVRQLASGLYSWLPLGLRVLRKVENIIRVEMDNAGAQELLMPVVQPSELWVETGRWEKMGAELCRLKDRHEREFCLGPTHEEVITDIFRREVNSYKDLPATYYQIQTKFRDEPRPRFGLMRAREFIMKDGYSFHSSENDLKIFYKKMEKSYENIFKNCGLETIGVDADSGAIGGAASKEFMVTANSGEDSILFTKNGSYAANIEKAVSLPKRSKPIVEFDQVLIKTPNQKTIEDICKFNNLDATQIVKVIIYLGEFDDKTKVPIAACIRGDQYINEIKIFNLLNKIYDSNLINLSIIESKSSINKNFVDSSKTLIEYFSITEDKIYIYFDSWNQLSNKVMMNRFNRH